MGQNLHFAATILLGLALWFPCPAQPGAGGSDTSGFIPLGSDARLNLRRTRLFLDAYSEVVGDCSPPSDLRVLTESASEPAARSDWHWF